MESPTPGGNSGSSVEHVVRQVFQDFLKSETAFRRDSREDVRDAHKLQVEIYQKAVEEIENATNKVREVEAKQKERIKRIHENSRAAELIKLKRQPFYTDLEKGLAEKYALLESSDLLPEISEDFRSNEAARERWRQRLIAESKDSLFVIPEVAVQSNFDKKIREDVEKVQKVKSDHSITRSTASRAVNVKRTRRSIIRAESQRTVLVADSNYVKFINFEPRKIYRKSVLIKNVSNMVAKFQPETRSPSSKFSISFESRSGDRENLAPGMSLRMIVVFSSEDGDDSEEPIVLKVQSGKQVLVVASAHRDPPILKGLNVRWSNYEPVLVEQQIPTDIDTFASFPESSEDSWGDIAEHSSFFSSGSSDCNYVHLRKAEVIQCEPLTFADLECKKCFVGEKIVVTTRLKNVGGDGRFFAMSEFDWNSMSIDDITTENTIVLQCFAVWPAYFALKRNEDIDLRTYFFPDSRGVQVDKLYIVCDNLSVHPIELLGDGEVYEPSMIAFGENVEENFGFDETEEEEHCEYSMNLGFEVPNGIIKNSFTVSNTSSLEMYYRWEKRSTDVREMRNRAKTWKDLPLDLLTVSPSDGVFRPCSSVTFEIEVLFTNLPSDLYRVVLQFYLEDIPLAAIPEEYRERTENSRKNRRLCETSRDIRVKEIELWALCTESPNSESLSSRISFESTEDSDVPQSTSPQSA